VKRAFEGQSPFDPLCRLSAGDGEPVSVAPLCEADQFPAVTAAPPLRTLASFRDVGAVGEFPPVNS